MLMYVMCAALMWFAFNELRYHANKKNLSRHLAEEDAEIEWAAYKKQHGWIGD